MTDTTGPAGESDSRPSALRIVRQNVDVLLVLVAFVALSYVTTSYEEAGLFPFVFLVAGTVFLSVELASQFLPDPYRTRIRNVLTRRMADVDISEDDDETASDDSASTRDVAVVIALLVVYFVVTYFVHFLAGTVVFTIAALYALGLRDYRLVVVTVVLVAIVYGVFGEIVNTPILE